jgi:hypothetical protein
MNIEVDATSTIANGWEELTFDFPGIVSSNNYQEWLFSLILDKRNRSYLLL